MMNNKAIKKYLILYFEDIICTDKYVLEIVDSNKHQFIKVKLITNYVDENKDRILNKNIKGISLSKNDYEILLDNIITRSLINNNPNNY